LGFLLFFLYAFFVSIFLMCASFRFLGAGFAERLIATTTDPFVGLFIGVLATSISQSSSTVTSMVVALVAAGGLDVQNAIPIIFGSNIGTSVTNTLVSLGHVSRGEEFKRAFAAATVHDFFNVLSVIVIFPLQLATNFIGRLSVHLAEALEESGGLTLINPLKVIVSPAVNLIARATSESGWVMLVLAVALLFVALRYIIVNVKLIVIGRVERFFHQTLFRNAGRAFALGLVFTMMVQSSSVTTSLAVPLAGAGILTLRQIFPYTLGANIGTTITAMLTALATGSLAAATVAIAHVLFNTGGLCVWWPLGFVPRFLAETLARYSAGSKAVPLLYVLILFFVVPLLLIYLVR
jgi:sodium-dependent phosphate cotransporter